MNPTSTTTKSHYQHNNTQIECSRAQLESDEVANVVVDAFAFFHGRHYCAEIVVNEDHVRRLFAYVSSDLPHSNTDVCSFQSNCIIDAIPRHGDHVTTSLQCLQEGR